jgi:hypothetical protein
LTRNWLRDLVIAARNIDGGPVDRLDDLGGRPFGAQFQHDVAIGLRWRHRIGGDLSGAETDEELLHRRNLSDAFLSTF